MFGVFDVHDSCNGIIMQVLHSDRRFWKFWYVNWRDYFWKWVV